MPVTDGRAERFEPPAAGSTPAPAADAPAESAAQRHGFVRLSDVKSRRIKWLVPGLVPFRGLTLLAGAGGLGKSTFAMRLAADLSRGRLLEDGEAGAALVVSTEDVPEEILRPRAAAAGADLSRVHLYRVPIEAGGALILPGDFFEFERVVAETQARLVVIDPILGALDVALDSHKDQHVRVVLGHLSRLAEELDLAVVMVAHVNKASSRDAYIRVSGSVALYNAARSVVLVTADPENPESSEPGESDGPVSRIVSQHKANYSRRVPPRRYEIRPIVLPDECDDRGRPLESSAIFYVEDAAGIDLADLLAEGGANGRDGAQPKTAAAVKFLEHALADREWHDSAGLKTLAGATGISERTLRRASQLLDVETESRGFPRSTYWRLPQPGQSGHAFSPSFGPTGEEPANPHEQAVLPGVAAPVGPNGPVGPRLGPTEERGP